MRTNIVLDDNLMSEALSLSDVKTKKAIVEEALKVYILLKKQEKVKNLRGKLTWTGNLDKMRTDK